MFIAIMIPFFGGLLAFFGGFAFAPTTYFVSVHILIIKYLSISYADQVFNYRYDHKLTLQTLYDLFCSFLV